MPPSFFFFFFNDTATTEIYTLSLHDALPISRPLLLRLLQLGARRPSTSSTCFSEMLDSATSCTQSDQLDRKSTRLNSSHLVISYAVFCLKKKKTKMLYLTYQQESFTIQFYCY